MKVDNCMSKDEKSQTLRIEILERTSTLVAASFAFIAAFAWNESFKLLFDRLFSEDAELIVYFTYSIIITIFAVLSIVMIVKATSKAKNRLEK